MPRFLFLFLTKTSFKIKYWRDYYINPPFFFKFLSDIYIIKYSYKRILSVRSFELESIITYRALSQIYVAPRHLLGTGLYTHTRHAHGVTRSTTTTRRRTWSRKLSCYIQDEHLRCQEHAGTKDAEARRETLLLARCSRWLDEPRFSHFTVEQWRFVRAYHPTGTRVDMCVHHADKRHAAIESRVPARVSRQPWLRLLSSRSADSSSWWLIFFFFFLCSTRTWRIPKLRLGMLSGW